MYWINIDFLLQDFSLQKRPLEMFVDIKIFSKSRYKEMKHLVESRRDLLKTII